MKKILKNKVKIIIICFFITISFISFFLFYNNFEFFSINNISDNYSFLQNKVNSSYWFYYLIFFLIYFFISVFALPLAAILCLVIGSLFGFIAGIILASFASSLGALMCFLLARYLFKDYIENKFNKTLKVINKGILQDGVYYLFFVRMTPIFPFFLINLLFSVTKIKAFTFYIISQIGMLLGTALFINAGTQISKIKSYEDILNKYVILSLILIALLPILIKKLLKFVRFKL